MAINFLTILNDTNSIVNSETNEITLTTERIKIDGSYEIKSPCKI